MVSAKNSILRGSRVISAIILLSSCGGAESQKFDAMGYIKSRVDNIEFVKNSIR